MVTRHLAYYLTIFPGVRGIAGLKKIDGSELKLKMLPFLGWDETPFINLF